MIAFARVLSLVPDGEACSRRILIFFFKIATLDLWNWNFLVQKPTLALALLYFLCHFSMIFCFFKLFSLYLLFSSYITLINILSSLASLLIFFIFLCSLEVSWYVYAPVGAKMFSLLGSCGEIIGSSKEHLIGLWTGDSYKGEYYSSTFSTSLV